PPGPRPRLAAPEVSPPRNSAERWWPPRRLPRDPQGLSRAGGTATFGLVTPAAVRCGPSPAARIRGEGFVMDKDLAGQVADIAQRVVASGAISANGHGN